MENKKTHSSGPMENAESILDAMMAERQKFSQKDSDARTNLISQARSLIAALETPMEYILQIIWANVRLQPLPWRRLTLSAYPIHCHTPSSRLEDLRDLGYRRWPTKDCRPALRAHWCRSQSHRAHCSPPRRYRCYLWAPGGQVWSFSTLAGTDSPQVCRRRQVLVRVILWSLA